MFTTRDNKLVYEIRDYQKTVTGLLDLIKQNDIKNIVSIYRGSIPLGVKLSNQYNLPLSIIDYQTRDKVGNKTDPYWMKDAIQNGNVLVIDDILDTGKTMIDVLKFIKDDKKDLGDMFIHTIFKAKSNTNSSELEKFGKFTFDYESDAWVIFEPWE